MNLQPNQIAPALRECISFQLTANQKQDIAPDETIGQAFNRAIDKIPQVKFINQAHYIKNVLLPAIEKKHGMKSANYQYYFGVFESLMYCIKLADNDQLHRRMYSQEKLYNEFLQKRVLFLESQLLKFTTLESLTNEELANEIFNRTSISK